MKRHINHAAVAFGCLSLILPNSVAFPIAKETTSALVSGNIAEILTATVDLGTFQSPSLQHKQRRILGKRNETWTVKAGDTGNSIASELSITFVQLAHLNPDIDWSNLQVGQVLMIPDSENALSTGLDTNTSSTIYTVVMGDTGYSIATDYGTSVDRLQSFNPKIDWYNLQVGQTLILPGQQLVVSTSLKATNTLESQQSANVPSTTLRMSSTSTTKSTTSSIAVTHFPSKRDAQYSNPPSRMMARQRAEDSLIQARAGSVIRVFTSTTTLTPLSTAVSSTVTVHVGDTAAIIATKYGISVVSLAVANPTVDLSNLSPGQVLNLPSIKSATFAYNQVASISSILSMTSTTLSTRLGGALSSTPTLSSSMSMSMSMQATVTVKSGDTYASIAAKYGISVDALANANIGIDSSKLKVGQVLNLPKSAKSQVTTAVRMYNTTTTRILPITSMTSTARTGLSVSANLQTYVVKNGDTGNAISAAYGISFSDLSKANPGVVWTNLHIGQVLNIPTQSTATSSTTSLTTSATPVSSNVLNRKSGTDIYLTYSGPPTNLSYPSIDTWMSFDALWDANSKYIGATCSFSTGTVAPNTAAENSALKNAILSVSSSTGVNPSFILALVMQESNGCVRVPTTSSWQGIQNPGLLQSYNGNGTCNSNGQALQPCPASEITLMLLNGIAGVQGVGIVPALKQSAMQFGLTWSSGQPQSQSTPANTTTSSNSTTTQATASASASASAMQKNINAHSAGQSGSVGLSTSNNIDKRAAEMLTSNLDEGLFYYMAARIYNSGSLPADLDLSAPTGSTQCYVSDIVNRLEGWVTAPYNCTLTG